MDKLELQRLLDGELDHEQRRHVLAQLDKQPADWRTVALALLEEQAFRQEIGSLTETRNEQNVRPVTVAPVMSVLNSKLTAGNGSVSRWLTMSLAASLLVVVGAFGGNWLASRLENVDSFNQSNVKPSVAIAKPVQPGPASLASDATPPRPIGELNFASDIGSSGDSVQVPIYEAAPEHLKQMLISQQQQIEKWNDQLRRRGFELDWTPEMLESRLPDGRPVIVPIQEVRVRSLGQ